MDFELNEEQQLMADSVRKYLTSAYDFEARKKVIASPAGSSQPAWTTLSEMGLTAIPFATSAGGFGGGAVDAYNASLSPRYSNYRKASNYAGSNEIQRNIIAKMTLGL